jgi:NAD(P)-dependent dehydrogenase (short-subunit alcohol dehydrogenase family)
MKNYHRYDGKNVMIVGCAQGIGYAVAKAYAQNGANLALLDRQERIKDVAAEFERNYKISAYAGVMDISKYEDCEKAAKIMSDKYGNIDVLAVIAGILPPQGFTVMDTPVEVWEKVINVNLNGHFYMTKAVIPYMAAQKSGNIILTGSWWGHAGHAFFASYCCTKTAIIKLTQALAEELAEYNIRVNCVCPGSINTDLHVEGLTKEAQKRGITIEEMKKIDYAKMAMARPGEPDEIADGYLYLSSDQASYITGISLDINGGGCFR